MSSLFSWKVFNHWWPSFRRIFFSVVILNERTRASQLTSVGMKSVIRTCGLSTSINNGIQLLAGIYKFLHSRKALVLHYRVALASPSIILHYLMVCSSIALDLQFSRVPLWLWLWGITKYFYHLTNHISGMYIIVYSWHVLVVSRVMQFILCKLSQTWCQAVRPTQPNVARLVIDIFLSWDCCIKHQPSYMITWLYVSLEVQSQQNVRYDVDPPAKYIYLFMYNRYAMEAATQLFNDDA